MAFMKMQFLLTKLSIPLAAVVLIMTGCGPSGSGGSDDSASQPQTVSVKGSIQNLKGEVTLTLNNEHSITLNRLLNYDFDLNVEKGFEYQLRVSKQPDQQSCLFSEVETGVIETNFNLSLVCTDTLNMTMRYDANGNGEVNSIEYSEFNTFGLQNRHLRDTNADGINETEFIGSYNRAGLRTVSATDNDQNGSYEYLVYTDYDRLNRKTQTTEDHDGDGTSDKITTFRYVNDTIENGEQSETYTDSDADGTFDKIEKHYNRNCGLVDYEDNDGDGVIEPNDGDEEVIRSCIGGTVTVKTNGVVTSVESTEQTTDADLTITTYTEDTDVIDGSIDYKEINRVNSNNKPDSYEVWHTFRHVRGELYRTKFYEYQYYDDGTLSWDREFKWIYGNAPSIVENTYNEQGLIVQTIRRAQDNLPVTYQVDYTYDDDGVLETTEVQKTYEHILTTFDYYASGRLQTQTVERDRDNNSSIDEIIITTYANATKESGNPLIITRFAEDTNADGVAENVTTTTYRASMTPIKTEVTQEGMLVWQYYFNEMGFETESSYFTDTDTYITTTEFDDLDRIASKQRTLNGVLTYRRTYSYTGNHSIQLSFGLET
jgi:hypothetical protein